jgi:glycosyltransferase involved in cell wall biosynthesis
MFDEVHVFSLHDGRSYNLGKRIFVHPLPGKGILGMLKNTLIFREIAKREKFDAVRILATTKSAFIAIFGLAFLNVPILLSVHGHRTSYQKQSGTEPHPLFNFFIRLWERFALWRADKILVISYFVKDYIVNDLGADPRKISLHRNFADIGLFKPTDIKKPTDRVRIVFVSRLVGAKSTDILIDAFNSMKQKNTELLIVGEGPEKSKLEHQAKQLGIEEKVKFPGGVKHEALPELLNGCHFFAAAGQTGFVLIESMSCGLPTVAAATDLAPEIVDKNSGILVPLGDRKALAQGMDEMIMRRQEWEKMGAAARKKIQEELSLDSYKKRELHFYRELINI